MKTNEKQFSFTQLETQMLTTIQQQYNVSLSNFVSFILMSRLNHGVDKTTKFELSSDFQSVNVWQEEDEPEKPAEPTVKLKGAK